MLRLLLSLTVFFLILGLILALIHHMNVDAKGGPVPFVPTLNSNNKVESPGSDETPRYVGYVGSTYPGPYFLYVSPITIDGISYFVVQTRVDGRLQVSLCPVGKAVMQMK